MKNTLLVAFFVLFISCKKQPNVDKISIASNGCNGECLVMSLEVEKSLSLKYHGIDFTPVKGFFTGKIDQDFWHKTENRLQASNFMELDTSYFSSYDDVEVEVIIHSNEKIKRINGLLGDMPQEFRNIVLDLMRLPEKIELKESKDSLTFEAKPKLQLSKIPQFLPGK